MPLAILPSRATHWRRLPPQPVPLLRCVAGTGVHRGIGAAALRRLRYAAFSFAACCAFACGPSEPRDTQIVPPATRTPAAAPAPVPPAPWTAAPSPAAPPPTHPPASSPLDPDLVARFVAAEPSQGPCDSMDADDLALRHPLAFVSPPHWDLARVKSFAQLQQSPLQLPAAESEALARGGMLIAHRLRHPTFFHAYRQVYQADLPVYITADSILHALQRSHTTMLQQLEQTVLSMDLAHLLTALRDNLAGAPGRGLPASTRADLDEYLAVPVRLLGLRGEPVAGGDPNRIAALVSLGEGADGVSTVSLFGLSRPVDFSQFRVRGHYAGSRELHGYFRAMTWLSRIDLRLLEPASEGAVKLNRRQLDAMLALRAVSGGEASRIWRAFDEMLSALMGEADAMQLSNVDVLVRKLRARTPREAMRRSDRAVAAALVESGLGRQRVVSHLVHECDAQEGTRPAARSFSLAGARYVADSEMLSQLVYDRLCGGTRRRMMPSPLDVAFTIFGNDLAPQLLRGQLQQHQYAQDLERLRTRMDAKLRVSSPPSQYERWLRALRAMSPGIADIAPRWQRMPSTLGTESWARRVLNTQLASWTELRHGHVLYAKQSYTSEASCEYPDAYVDPYPQLFSELHAWAAALSRLLGARRTALTKVAARQGQSSALQAEAAIGAMLPYLEHVGNVMKMLADAAVRERAGESLTEEQLAFVNDIVSESLGCDGTPHAVGWYPKLFYAEADARVPGAVVVDVHTQPTDEHGNPVGRVLHVGTGAPRQLLVVLDAGDGPRLYVGPVSAYHQIVTEKYSRITDSWWRLHLERDKEPDVWWMEPLVVGGPSPISFAPSPRSLLDVKVNLVRRPFGIW